MNVTNLTITDIIEGYKAKKFSVSEIVSSYLDRIEKLNPTLNAFITVENENAKRNAKELDNLLTHKPFSPSPLFGVPYGIKDMFLTKGVRTTAASAVLNDYIPQYSATVVDRLETAGAIPRGGTQRPGDPAGLQRLGGVSPARAA